MYIAHMVGALAFHRSTYMHERYLAREEGRTIRGINKQTSLQHHGDLCTVRFGRL